MKKRLLSILTALALCLTLLPMAALAADDTVKVSSASDLKAALKNDTVKSIDISSDLKYTDDINADNKTITIQSGVTFTLSVSQTTVTTAGTGSIVNNGTIKVTGGLGATCFWKAQTTGTGKIIAENESFGTYYTYVDYGCVPDAMLEGSNCQINIVKDISTRPTVSLPDEMHTGDTITTLTFTNLIDGVDTNLSNVFTFTWKNGNGFGRYNGATSPTLTETGTLKLNVSAKKPYVMCSPNGSYGSLDATGTVAQKSIDTVYVDSKDGDDNALGETEDAPVKSIDKAIANVKDGGTIVLLNDHTESALSIDKNVTITSREGQKYALSSPGMDGIYIKKGTTVTFDSITISDTSFTGHQSGTGSIDITFQNCSGTGNSFNNSNVPIDKITLKNSQLGGSFYTNSLTIDGSELSGTFHTTDFTAAGTDRFIPDTAKGKTSRIEGNISIASPISITFADAPTKATELIQVPGGSSDDLLGQFTVPDGLRLAYLSSSSSSTCIGVEIPVTGIEATNTALRMAVGTHTTLDFRVLPENATKRSVTCISSNESVATVNSSGYVSALKAGETTITVTTVDGNYQADYQVTVYVPVTSVALNKSALTLTIGATVKLTATVSPDDAADKSVIWSSDNEPVATVSDDGTVTAVAAGTATITVTTTDGGKTASCTVTVNAAAVPDPTPTPTPTSSSSRDDDDDDPSYSVTVPSGSSVANGSIQVTPRNAEKGSRVTITVVPDTGYVLGSLTVTDYKGNALTLTDAGDGKYTFTMPGSAVKTSVSFVPEPVTPSPDPDQAFPFTDVKTDAYYREAVRWAVDEGITSGTSATTFGPDLPCTRGQIVTFLWRAAGSPAPTGALTFTDVAAGSYCADAVRWAAENGIASGTSKETFSPDLPCTRAQMAAFLYRSQKSPAVSGSSAFTDVSAGDYFHDAVLWAAQNGITNGISATAYGPDAICTRAQMVMFLYRLMGK